VKAGVAGSRSVNGPRLLEDVRDAFGRPVGVRGKVERADQFDREERRDDRDAPFPAHRDHRPRTGSGILEEGRDAARLQCQLGIAEPPDLVPDRRAVAGRGDALDPGDHRVGELDVLRAAHRQLAGPLKVGWRQGQLRQLGKVEQTIGDSHESAPRSSARINVFRR
jgi:hypothetical protein